jgi:hypothetical protein
MGLIRGRFSVLSSRLSVKDYANPSLRKQDYKLYIIKRSAEYLQRC